MRYINSYVCVSTKSFKSIHLNSCSFTFNDAFGSIFLIGVRFHQAIHFNSIHTIQFILNQHSSNQNNLRNSH